MKIVEPGHIYQFHSLDRVTKNPDMDYQEIVRFVNREVGTEHPGTQTQDVLRALIDRTMHCDNCIPWDSNIQIIHHMRMAIAYHEARALERKAEKGLYFPELIVIGKDGHFQLQNSAPSNDNQSYHNRRKVLYPAV